MKKLRSSQLWEKDMLTQIFSPIIDNITQILESSIMLLTKNESLKQVFSTGEKIHYNNMRT